MSAVLDNASNAKSYYQADDESLLDKFAARKSKELVIAFAGPIGCGIASVINITAAGLKSMGYAEVITIKLSDFLTQSQADGNIPAPEPYPGKSVKYSRYRNLQRAGMDLRLATENQAILAEFAIKKIVLDRGMRQAAVASDDVAPVVPGRVAYLIDQVKRPEEIALLRALYRNLFFVIGVTKTYSDREAALDLEGVKLEEFEELIEVDRNEDAETGQRLDKTLHLSDFFLRNDYGVNKQDSITRFLHLIHGDKSKTPTVVEQGMYAAYAAGLRSACLSRQVGAAIGSSTGEILATGCNDVPRAGGGLYGAGLPGTDSRCVHNTGSYCSNDRHKQALLGDIERQINMSLGKPIDGEVTPVITEARKKLLIDSAFQNTKIKDLIEFSRSVHAEMDAIVSLARTGGTSVKGTTLYTTTFPCHSCARHIVAAGIQTVYYIEPYEKSLARDLHSDAISFEFSDNKDKDKDKDKEIERVKFLHFEGISPRQFPHVFRSLSRKDKHGVFIKIEIQTAENILPEYLDNYQDFEKKAVQHFQKDIGMLIARKNS